VNVIHIVLDAFSPTFFYEILEENRQEFSSAAFRRGIFAITVEVSTTDGEHSAMLTGTVFIRRSRTLLVTVREHFDDGRCSRRLRGRGLAWSTDLRFVRRQVW
jgi:hypothetical protein